MLIYKQKVLGKGVYRKHYQGWFLFGFIPLVVWKIN